MDPFVYFFGFYSIVLGLSAVELLAGVARTIEAGRVSQTSRLTLMLALFVALDLSSYWLQAWVLYRQAPLSMAIITHGLIAAGSYYVAAYLIFPRNARFKRAKIRDEHFWSVRRWVFGAVLLTNVLNVGTIALLTGGLGFIGSVTDILFTATFYVACAVAALAPRGRWVVVALGWLVAFSLLVILLDSLRIVAAGGWALGGAPAG